MNENEKCFINSIAYGCQIRFHLALYQTLPISTLFDHHLHVRNSGSDTKAVYNYIKYSKILKGFTFVSHPKINIFIDNHDNHMRRVFCEPLTFTKQMNLIERNLRFGHFSPQTDICLDCLMQPLPF